MKKTICFITILFSAAFILCSLNSCVNSKKLAYFNNLKRDSVAKIQVQNLQTTIKKNDILQVYISTPDDITNKQLNVSATVGLTTGTSTGVLVDEDGIIQMPVLGSIKAEGLTKKQLSDLITKKLTDGQIAKNPIVSVRIQNYRITVIGEVNHPGVVQVPSERITLPEALASAGDLTVYGRRNDILLIRETDGERITRHIDLNNGKIFDPEVYNLQNQDIIYVSPINSKAGVIDRSPQLVSLVVTAVSLIIVIYVQFIK
jgi:polysaccharide export outer membrane protein